MNVSAMAITKRRLRGIATHHNHFGIDVTLIAVMKKSERFTDYE
jgi:hypothetical protein